MVLYSEDILSMCTCGLVCGEATVCKHHKSISAQPIWLLLAVRHSHTNLYTSIIFHFSCHHLFSFSLFFWGKAAPGSDYYQWCRWHTQQEAIRGISLEADETQKSLALVGIFEKPILFDCQLECPNPEIMFAQDCYLVLLGWVFEDTQSSVFLNLHETVRKSGLMFTKIYKPIPLLYSVIVVTSNFHIF